MGGSFHLTWEEGRKEREVRMGGSFHLTPSPFTSAKTATFVGGKSLTLVVSPLVAAVKKPLPSLIQSSLSLS